MLFKQSNSVLRILVASAVLPLSARAQTSPTAPLQAQVTFYSTGSFWKGGLPGYKHGVFVGLLFDDKAPLAHMKPGRFVTFTFAPGPHTFSTNYWVHRSPSGGAHLKLDLVAGQHYYVGTYFETDVVVSLPRIELTSCLNAQRDAAKAKPLEQKNIEKPALSVATTETSFPSCP
jgi:hypothetical protein